MVSSTPRPYFIPGKEPVPIVQEAMWAPGLVWTGAENLARPGFDPRTAQPVVSRYTDCATRLIFLSYGKINVKVKVKVTLVQALKLCTGRTAYRGSRGIALPFHEHGTRRGEGSASRSGRSLRPGKARYPLYRRLDGPQGRSG